MTKGNYRTLVPPTYHKALIFTLELAVCLSGGIGNFAQHAADDPVSFSGTAAFPFAGAFIVAGTHAGP